MIKITNINKQCFILTDEGQDANALANLFEPSYLQENGLIVGSAMGRAKVNIFDFKQQHYVLRHYRRGGLIAKVLEDNYIWAGLKNTRAYQEFNLLLKLQRLGLPSSQPLAARVKRSGLTYTTDLITQYVANTETLAARFSANKNIPWKTIGKVIAQFHKQQVYHDDLNAHNILINNNDDVFVIDFDKGKIAPGERWKQNNLERLQRSLKKLKPCSSIVKNWLLVASGYNHHE